jgi:hypothetical protein
MILLKEYSLLCINEFKNKSKLLIKIAEKGIKFLNLIIFKVIADTY